VKIKTTVLVLLLGILMAFGITVHAETDGTYVYSVTNDVATITGVADKTTFTGEQIIPEKIGDYTVTKIATSAFKDCTGLTTISVPDTVTSIGSGAFEGCTSLEELSIPKDTYGTTSSSRFGYIFGHKTVKGTSKPSTPTGTTYQNYYYDYSSGNDEYYFYTIPASLRKVTITNDTEIGANAFYNCSNITEIVLCNKVTNIGENAFYNCNNLKKIDIGDSVTSIGASSFYYCSSLTAVTIPETLTSIGSTAFYDCNTLTNIIIPDSVTTIGSGAFNSCDNLVNVSLSSAIQKIESNLFSGCINLQNISIPVSVTSIGSKAFYNCTTFTEVTIPDGVTTIGASAFEGCNNTTKLYIGKNVTSIATSAFKDCTGLTTISVPDTVTSIGSGAFEGCTSLEELSIPKDTYGTTSSSRFGYIFGHKTVKGTSKPSTPTGTTYQNYYYDYSSGNDEYYFYTIPASLRKVTITNDTEIGANAFYNCSNITEIVLCNKVTNIGENAFYNCTWFNNLSDEFSLVGDGVLIKYTSDNNDVIIPENVKHIAPRVFYNKTNITNITLHNNLKTIGSYAFYGLSQVSTYDVPNSVSAIGTSAFGSGKTIKCYSDSYAHTYAKSNNLKISLKNLTETIGTDTYHYIVNEDGRAEIVGCVTTATEITIPETLGGAIVTKIGDSAFKNCETITSVTITSYITEIGPRAFYGCTGIEDVTIPTTVTSVGEYAFYNCTAIKNITISNGLLAIGGHAFENCTSLTAMTLPSSLVKLGEYAFYGCTGLESITMGQNLEAIEEYTFYGCTLLSSATIGRVVAYIDDYAFYNTGLERIVIPEATKRIGKFSFANCDSLARVQLRSGLETIDKYAFSGDVELYQISLPTTVITIGEYAFNKCEKIEQIEIPDGVTRIENSTFNGCSSLSSVVLGDKTAYIGKSAFDGCAFTEIELPETVSEIDNTAFARCTSLEGIYIPDSVERIGDGAFYAASNFCELSVADKLASIGAASFYETNNVDVEIRKVNGTVTNNLFENQSIASVTMNDGITAIGNRAFSGCQLLTVVNYPESLVNIGDYAFYDNIGYSKVILPDNVETIGTYAYANSIYLNEMSFSDKMKTIGTFAFNDTNDLTVNIRCVDKSIEDNVLKSQNVLHIIIEDNVETIGASAFADSNVITISMPDTITSVGNEAFKNSYEIGLTIRAVSGSIVEELLKNDDGINRSGTISSITINDGIDTIGTAAFESVVCDSIKVLGDVKVIGASAFKNGSATSVLFKGNVDEIGVSAFENYTADEIRFAGNANTISDNAFYNSAVKVVVIDKNVESFGVSSFEKSLIERLMISGNVNEIKEKAFHNCLKLVEVSFGGELKSIGISAFNGCKLLPEMVLPESVQSIGGYAFYDCNTMTSINLPSSITKINESTFYGCASLKEVSMPNGIESVGDYAYYGCTSLKNINFSDNLKKIGKEVFYNCYLLKEIQLPNGLEEIGEYALRSCTGLSNIIIPDSVVDLGGYVFYDCTSLKDVYLGQKVTIIPEMIFYGCDELQKVTLSDDTTYIDPDAFYGCWDVVLYCASNDYVKEYADENYYTYHDTSLDFELNITAPKKTTYMWGDELELEGMTVSLRNSDGENVVVTNYEINGYDKETLGEQTITVTYKTQSKIFTVTVIERTCGEDETVEHIWDDGEITKEPTNKETGIMTYTCRVCSTTREEEVPMLPDTHEHQLGDWTNVNIFNHIRQCECGYKEKEEHSWDEGKVTTEPTETTSGIRTYTCSVCKGIKTEEIPADPELHEHSYGEWKQLDEETHIHECDCGEEELEEHTWNAGEVTTEPTHTTTGVRTYTCSVCKGTKTEEIDTLEEHEFSEWTYVDEETHTRECECGETETEEHRWNNGVVTTPATSTTTGIKTFTCTGCYKEKTEIIDMITDTHEHSYGEWVAIDEEEHVRTCECGEEVTGTHNWDEGEVLTEPTHFDTGDMIYRCIECGFMRDEVLERTDDHEFGNWEYYDEDSHRRECFCGSGEEFNGHSWDEGTITTKPTLTSTGIKTFTCVDCNGTMEEEVEMLVASGSIVVGNVTGKAGDTVEVKVTLSDNEGIAGMVLNLTYDEELTLVEAVQGDALPNMAFTAPGDYSKNPVNLVWDAMEADASNGHIVTLKFQISEDAEERDYEVNLSYKPGAICDNDMNDVDFTITNGVITVKNYTPGDVNGDGEVDVKDIIILRRFIAGGYEITYVEAAVDINRDGSNDAKDIITLRRFVADGYGIILK